MDKTALLNLLTGPLARGVSKLALIIGGGTTTMTADKSTQIASAILTLIVFVFEQWQSWKHRSINTPKE